MSVHHTLQSLGAIYVEPRLFEFKPDLTGSTVLKLGEGRPRAPSDKNSGANYRSWMKLLALYAAGGPVTVDVAAEAVKDHEHPGGGKNFIVHHCVRHGWLEAEKPTTIHVCGKGDRINVDRRFSAETLCAFAYEGAMYVVRQGDFLDYETKTGPIRMKSSWIEKGSYNGEPTKDIVEKISRRICDLSYIDEGRRNLSIR